MIRVSLVAAASPAQAYDVLLDVADWPTWTDSVDAVHRLDDGPLRVGSRVRIDQPELGTNTYEVTVLVRDREFTWVARHRGVTTTARHVLTPVEDGTRIELSVEHAGPLAWLARLLTDKTSRRFVAMEAAGLVAAAEARATVD